MSEVTASAFFEPGSFPWTEQLVQAWSAIRAEAEEVIARYRYLRFAYPDRYGRQNPMVVGDRATFYLTMYGMELERNRAFCPETTRVVSQAVPGLVNAAVYLLDARSRILPHTGATDQVLRGHLGLVVQPGSYLRVGTEVRGWQQAGLLVFDDTLDHEAWNETDQCRAILLFDFFRSELPTEARHAHLRELRRRIPPADVPWLAAARTRTDDDEVQQILDSVRVSPTLDGIVAASGLYLR